jgi:predicted ATP-grasp superfamily ATP-dependent carboligase
MAEKPGAIIIEGHVQGLSNTRSLGEACIPVIVVDKNKCIARYSKYCKKFFRCPDFQSDAFADFLMELGEQENLQGGLLLPSNDHAVYSISRHKERLEKIFKVFTPAEKIITQIYNKQKLLTNAEKSGTTYPASWFPVKYDEAVPVNLQFPVLVKGKFGLNFYKGTGRKAFLILDAARLDDLLKKLSAQLPATDLFIQELIQLNAENKTLSFCAFCDNGEVKTFWMGKKLREHPVEFGTATFAESVYVEEIIEPASRLLQQLNYTGPCEVEFLLDPADNQYKLIEINARTWLWVGLAKACGVNFALMTYNYVNGIEPFYPSQYETGMKWRNIFTDIPFSLLARMKGKYTSVIKGKERRTIDALWMKEDRRPFFMYPVLIFNFFKNR